MGHTWGDGSGMGLDGISWRNFILVKFQHEISCFNFLLCFNLFCFYFWIAPPFSAFKSPSVFPLFSSSSCLNSIRYSVIHIDLLV